MRKLKATMCVVIGAVMTATTPAASKQYKASKLQYHNNGAYVGYLRVEYRVDFGGQKTRCQIEPKNKDMSVPVNGSVTLDMTGGAWLMIKGEEEECLDADGKIPVGIEVWGRIRIGGGKDQICRKDTAIIYTKTGGTMKYVSGGTTLNNNRCKVLDWP